MNWIASDLACFFDRGQNAFYILFGRRSVSFSIGQVNQHWCEIHVCANGVQADCLRLSSREVTCGTRGSLVPSRQATMDRMMRTALFLAHKLTLLLLLVAMWFSPTWAAAQVQIPAAALADQTALDELLRQGDEYEREHRWSDALTHYENALRDSS